MDSQKRVFSLSNWDVGFTKIHKRLCTSHSTHGSVPRHQMVQKHVYILSPLVLATKNKQSLDFWTNKKEHKMVEIEASFYLVVEIISVLQSKIKKLEHSIFFSKCLLGVWGKRGYGLPPTHPSRWLAVTTKEIWSRGNIEFSKKTNDTLTYNIVPHEWVNGVWGFDHLKSSLFPLHWNSKKKKKE